MQRAARVCRGNWIGCQVIIQIEGTAENAIKGELLEVNVRGVIISRVPDEKTFFPWRMIQLIALDERTIGTAG